MAKKRANGEGSIRKRRDVGGKRDILTLLSVIPKRNENPSWEKAEKKSRTN